MDIDVFRRRAQPHFYGFVPDHYNSRSITFLLMQLISSIHNFSRTAGFALLATTNVSLVVLFMAGEFAAILLCKHCRGDLAGQPRWDLVGKEDGPTKIFIITFVIRLIEKVLSDFCGMLFCKVSERLKRENLPFTKLTM